MANGMKTVFDAVKRQCVAIKYSRRRTNDGILLLPVIRSYAKAFSLNTYLPDCFFSVFFSNDAVKIVGEQNGPLFKLK